MALKLGAMRKGACAAVLFAVACAANPPPALSDAWQDMPANDRAARLGRESGADFRLLSLPDALVRFIDVGTPANPGDVPVVFVHGLAGTMGDLGPLLLRMRANHRVVALDLPGWGGSRSRTGRYGVGAYVDVLAGFLRRVAGPRAHLVCHSMGGQICIGLAVSHPELFDRLTLISPAGVYQRPRYIRAKARQFGKVNLGVMHDEPPERSLLAGLGRGDSALLDRFVIRDPAVLAMLASFQENQRDRLPLLRVPTLIVWGGEDPILPMEDAFVVAASVPGATLHIVEPAGHEPHLTHTETVHDWIEAHHRRR